MSTTDLNVDITTINPAELRKLNNGEILVYHPSRPVRVYKGGYEQFLEVEKISRNSRDPRDTFEVHLPDGAVIPMYVTHGQYVYVTFAGNLDA